MYTLDLHTHSQASPDGSLRLDDYRRMLASGQLTHIAITDHDRVDFAQAAQKELGEAIIVGEEITTADGELIGLYLREFVASGHSARATAQAIHAQGGLVYVPHPFEKVRKGMQPQALDAIAQLVDIIEIYNGRALASSSAARAQAWAEVHHAGRASSSDAHGFHGWGKTYSMVTEPPAAANLAHQLRRPAVRFGLRHVGLRGVLYPKYNRLRKRHR